MYWILKYYLDEFRLQRVNEPTTYRTFYKKMHMGQDFRVGTCCCV
jgi:hypothetical protein